MSIPTELVKRSGSRFPDGLNGGAGGGLLVVDGVRIPVPVGWLAASALGAEFRGVCATTVTASCFSGPPEKPFRNETTPSPTKIRVASAMLPAAHGHRLDEDVLRFLFFRVEAPSKIFDSGKRRTPLSAAAGPGRRMPDPVPDWA